MGRTLDRLAPLTGTLFAVLTLVALIGLGGSTPDSDATAAKVVTFYTHHRGQQDAAAIVLLFGALALIFFAGSLREAFRGPEPAAERRSTIAFGATLIAAAGVLLMAGSHFALADNTHKISPQAAQALNALDGGTWTMAFVGMTALLLSSGVLALTTQRLPAWMGWSAIVLGILAVTPIGYLAVAVGVIWVGVLGIVLWRRAEAIAPSTEAAVPPPPATPASSPA